jgi:tetratricopeptide (TPR) repeat protein
MDASGARPPGGGALSIALGASVLFAGCGASPAPTTVRAAEPPRLVTAEALGVSVGRTAAAVPRDLEALPAFVEELGGRPPLRIDRDDGPAPDPTTFLARVAGTAEVPVDVRGAIPASPGEGLLVTGRSPWSDERLSRADAHLAAGRFPEARAALSAAARLEPTVAPAAEASIAASYGAEGRWEEALAAYQEVAARYDWSFAAQLGLGETWERLGRPTTAAGVFGRALALRPTDGELLRRLAEGRRVELAAPVLPPAWRRPAAGAGVWTVPLQGIGAGEEAFALTEARAYAGCKEAFRLSERLRRAAAGLPGVRWRWSPAEESVCTALWLRTYGENRTRGRTSDRRLDELAAIAEAGFLDERALFDVGAPAFPAAPLLLTREQRSRLFTFVARFRAVAKDTVGLPFALRAGR